MEKADLEYAEDVLAQGDPDRYVSAFFAPAPLRPALTALYAFDHEVARIGWSVREPMAGHIRLAWWRAQIAAIYAGGALEAPGPRALAAAVKAHALPREVLERYLDARAHDLEEAPFADEVAFDAYAQAVVGGVLKLAVRVLGAGELADAAASHAAVAVAAAEQRRHLAFLAEHRRCRLPVDWLEAVGANAEDVFAGSHRSEIRHVTQRLHGKALAALRALNGSRFPTRATPALAVATLARWAPGAAMPPWQRVARLALANLTWRM